MITLHRDFYKYSEDEKKAIEQRIIDHTLKRNINPQLIFSQTYYQPSSDKLFVGNHTKDGFWLSKFRYQLLQLRPDVLVFLDFNYLVNNEKLLCIKYSIGFSSLVQGLICLALISYILFQFFVFVVGTETLVASMLGCVFALVIYIALLLNAFKSSRELIEDRILT